MSGESKTLYVGNLNQQVTEQFMHVLFSQMGNCLGCKMIYEPGQDPYCFVEFADHASAAQALTTMNGREVMGKPMKVNWATSPNSKNSAEMARGRVDTSGVYQQQTRRVDTSDHFHIFCGDLSPDIETKQLRESFAPFGDISDCKVICDIASGKSKGYGFISFINKEDAQKAINEMNGAWLGSRAIRTNWATRKPPAPVERPRASRTLQKLNYDEVFAQASSTNTTVYIGGIQENLHDEMLTSVFEQYGPVAEIRCFTEKGFAFVRLQAKEAAAQAIVGLNGTEVGGYTVRCAWGKEAGGSFPSSGGMGGYGGGQQQQSFGNGYGSQPAGGYGGYQQNVAQNNWGGANGYNYAQQQQWGAQPQQQQWGAAQQQWGGQWGAGQGDASNWQQQQQSAYQQPAQGYQAQGNYNYSGAQQW